MTGLSDEGKLLQAWTLEAGWVGHFNLSGRLRTGWHRPERLYLFPNPFRAWAFLIPHTRSLFPSHCVGVSAGSDGVGICLPLLRIEIQGGACPPQLDYVIAMNIGLACGVA